MRLYVLVLLFCLYYIYNECFDLKNVKIFFFGYLYKLKYVDFI